MAREIDYSRTRSHQTHRNWVTILASMLLRCSAAWEWPTRERYRTHAA